MPTIDPRIDAYIAAAPDFAKPILDHLRAIIHAACPEVEETMKWSFPHFMYKGMLCGMSAFKAHCALGFWKGELLIAKTDDKGKEAMGQFGRIASVKDLPSKKELTVLVKRAMKLNDDGVKAAPGRTKAAAPKPAPTTPPYLAEALATRPSALEHYTAFTPSKQREYVEWLEEAKTDATRLRRLEQAVEWIAEGKARNWKYEKC
jgi:uncharacterized protein YdeI (YjbR/CyaY-like superfamily)